MSVEAGRLGPFTDVVCRARWRLSELGSISTGVPVPALLDAWRLGGSLRLAVRPSAGLPVRDRLHFFQLHRPRPISGLHGIVTGLFISSWFFTAVV